VRRGELRIYLGATTGVGKTYAMLDEACRRRERGADVMIGCIDTHGRPSTIAQLRRLTDDQHPPLLLDIDAVRARRPAVLVVDDLARMQPPSAAHRHRWQEVDALLAEGIDVISTLDVSSIESLADSIERITGTAPTEVVPDEFIAHADQVQLVDITPEAIRRRVAHGNVYGPEELDPATADLFSGESFAQLRALMLRWMSDRLTARPDDAREARECVVVAITGAASSDAVVRRAARLAQRSRARLIGVTVAAAAAPNDPDTSASAALVRDVGGTFHRIQGHDVAASLVEFAEAHGATQLVLGTSARTRLDEWRRGSVIDRVLRSAGRIDVHVISTPTSGRRHRPPLATASPLGPRRQLLGFAVAVLALLLTTVLLVQVRTTVGESTSLAVYLLVVVAVSAIGGLAPGLSAAVMAPLLANWFLIAPYHTFRIADRSHVVELLVFVAVAVAVSSFVSISARRALEAERARREATILAELAGPVGSDPLDRIVDHLRTSFSLDGVALLRRDSETADWVRLAAAGNHPPAHPDAADVTEPVDDDVLLVATGGVLTADDHRVLGSFVQQLRLAIEQQRLSETAARAEVLDRADELRTAMLRAVSHDLRTPLAGIKASVSSLRQHDVEWPPEVRDEFLEAIEDDTDRLTAIVTNLLDLSRLQAGVLRPSLRPVALEEVIPAALHSLGAGAEAVRVELPDQPDDLVADPALLERVVANLVGNALTWSPAEGSVRLAVHRRGDSIQVHVVDHGPGIRPAQRAQVLQPFHRLGDGAHQPGLGLGLAIADGLTAAMGGHLELRDTPGGGLTAVITLPRASEGAA